MALLACGGVGGGGGVGMQTNKVQYTDLEDRLQSDVKVCMVMMVHAASVCPTHETAYKCPGD